MKGSAAGRGDTRNRRTGRTFYNAGMSKYDRYRKKSDSFVTAVRLDLDTDGFDYRKWGGVQHCKPGDWVVDNDGDVYTIDAAVFQRTYRKVSPGVYVKDSAVFAYRASEHGRVQTLEGESVYAPGDFIVSNNADGSDAYCMSAEKFHAMYEPDE